MPWESKNKKMEITKFIFKYEKLLSRICIILIVLSVLTTSYLIYSESKFSYDHQQNGTLFKQGLDNKQYGGVFYDNGSISLFKNSTLVLRHELCHKDQHKNNKTYTIWSEVECNIKEWFIWKKVNLSTLDYD